MTFCVFVAERIVTTIIVFPDVGPLSSETCRDLEFLKI
jgi:hypothetical protein